MDPSLRILHVTEALGGGLLGVVVPLAERLAEAGHRVTLAHGERPETPRALREEVDPAVEVVALPWRRRTAREQLRAARALRRLVREQRPDVVHLHSSFAGVVGALAVPATIPRVYTPHGYSFSRSTDHRARRAAYLGVERLVARRVDLVGAVSESEAAQAREIVGARRVTVVANGIPELDDGRLPAVPPRPHPVVLGLGRADAARRPAGTGRILAALRDVAEVEWVGGGTATDAGIRTLRAYGIPVTGWLDQDEAKARLAGATAYLHWSAWDGQPLAVLEAMARDVAVVASDIPPNRELVGAAQVCAGEEEAIALLRAIVADGAVRDRLIAAQRERRAHYSAARMAGEWETVYRRLCGVAPVPEPLPGVPAAP